MVRRFVPLVLLSLAASCSGGPGPTVQANEIRAIGALRNINQAEISYAATCGQGGYATSLTVLGVPAPGATQAFLPPELTSGATVTQYGYAMTLASGADAKDGPLDCHGKPTRTDYYAKAEPATPGSSGTRSFATTSGNTVWQLNGATAPREPFGAPATPVQ